MTSPNARDIRLLVLDVDGVLTNGGLQFDARGEEYKTFNSLDGHGIRMLLDNAIEVAIIAAAPSRASQRACSATSPSEWAARPRS